MRTLSIANLSKKKREVMEEVYVDHEFVHCVFLMGDLRSLSMLMRKLLMERILFLPGVSWEGERACLGRATSPTLHQ